MICIAEKLPLDDDGFIDTNELTAIGAGFQLDRNAIVNFDLPSRQSVNKAN
jgi:hypothetical protein